MIEHLPLVRSIVRRMGLAHDPDALSAGMLGLLDAARKHATAAPFDAYARLRIRGAVLDYLRGQPEPHDELDEQRVASDDDPALSVERRDQVAHLTAVLEDRERVVIGLHYGQDCPVDTIAEGLGVTQGRVSQIHRAALERMRYAAGAELR